MAPDGEGQGQAEPQSGKAKSITRVRNACNQCRANKQRCDGPSRHPCRRCELYGIECVFPGGPSTSSSSTSKPASSNRSANSEALPTSSVNEILERLKSIELGMERLNAQKSQSSSDADRPSPQSSTLVSDSSLATTEVLPLPDAIDFQNEEAAQLNPVRLVSQTMQGIASLDISSLQTSSQTSATAKSIPPDAILRGAISMADCQVAFNFYHDKIQPWLPGDSVRHDPATLRLTSPFLFHVILVTAAYYSREERAAAQVVLEKLTSIVNDLLVEIVLASDGAKFNYDLVTSFVILLMYRPVQHNLYASRGFTSTESMEHHAKNNALSGSMLQHLIEGAAAYCHLHSAPAAFLKSVWKQDNDAAAARKAVQDLRLWYYLSTLAVHGALQAGRKANRDPREAARTTRILVALKADPLDPRRAAMLEQHAVIAPYTALISSAKILSSDVAKINADLDQWEVYWRPILREAQVGGDKLAYTILQMNLQFICVSTNITVFHRWASERKASLASGGDGRPGLSDADWSQIGRAARAAEKMIYTLSSESESPSEPLRSYIWPAKSDNNLPSLHVSPTSLEHLRVGLDTLTCTVFMFAILMLIRMANSGLISNNLTPRQHEYEAGVDLNTPQALVAGRKLSCLIELAANFLESVAPRSTHPSRKQASLLRLIRRAGLGESSAAAASPSQARPRIPPSTTTPVVPTPQPWTAPPLPIDIPDLSQPRRSSTQLTMSSGLSPTSPRLPPGPAVASLLSNMDPFMVDAALYRNNMQEVSTGLDLEETKMADDFDMDSFDWDALQMRMEQGPDWSLLTSI